MKPNRELVEREMHGKALELIKREYNHYMGWIFEKASLDLLWGKFAFEHAGRWWNRGEEIDVVGTKDGTAYFFEAKWEELSRREVRGVLKDLKRKAELVKSLKSLPRRFGLIAKSVEGKEELREEGYFVFDLEDFERLTPVEDKV